MLTQKDFEYRLGFSPIVVRPINMFATGYYQITTQEEAKLAKRYKNALQIVDPSDRIFKLNLKQIWEKDYNKLSCPKFKYLLYLGDKTLNLMKNT